MTGTVEARSQKSESTRLDAAGAVSFSSAGSFKYYIHDTAQGYTLQLLGDLTDHQVSELNCCWMTARNTLKGRNIVLDLRGVKHVDERGKQWLAGMAVEGASYIPESFLRDALADHLTGITRKNTVKFGLLDRVIAAFRSCTAE
jgi:anti-anti-sigma regulatory factor